MYVSHTCSCIWQMRTSCGSHCSTIKMIEIEFKLFSATSLYFLKNIKKKKKPLFSFYMPNPFSTPPLLLSAFSPTPIHSSKKVRLPLGEWTESSALFWGSATSLHTQSQRWGVEIKVSWPAELSFWVRNRKFYPVLHGSVIQHWQ